MAKAYARGERIRGLGLRELLGADPEAVRAARMMAGTAGTPTASETATTAAGKLGVGDLKKLLAGKGLRTAATYGVGYMLLEGLLRTLLQGSQQISQTNLAAGELEAQGAGLTPEAVRETALQPVTRAQRDYALQMLMQQLAGGRGTPTRLARGEVLT